MEELKRLKKENTGLKLLVEFYKSELDEKTAKLNSFMDAYTNLCADIINGEIGEKNDLTGLFKKQC